MQGNSATRREAMFTDRYDAQRALRTLREPTRNGREHEAPNEMGVTTQGTPKPSDRSVQNTEEQDGIPTPFDIFVAEVAPDSQPFVASRRNDDMCDNDNGCDNYEVPLLENTFRRSDESPDAAEDDNLSPMDENGLVSESDKSDGDNDVGQNNEEDSLDEEEIGGTDSVVCMSPSLSEPYGVAMTIALPELRTMRRRMKTIVSWEQMVACVGVSSGVALNERQYRYLVNALDTVKPSLSMRAYAGVKNKFWRSVMRFAAPKSEILHVSDRLSPVHKDYSRIRSVNAGWKHAGDCVRIVMPSEWAKLDIATDCFFKSVFEQVETSHQDIISIERSPIIQHRRIYCGEDTVLWSLYRDAVCPCEQNDHVTFNCNKAVKIATTTSYETMWRVTTVQDTPYSIVHGKVGPIWCVLNTANYKPVGDMSEDEREVFTLLKNQSFTSFEAIKQRNRNQRTLQDAGQPGILQLCIGDVCMFFRPQEGERSTEEGSVHCLFVGSPVSHAYGGSVELLIWIATETSARGTKYVRTLSQRSIRGLPKWVSGRRRVPVPTGKRMRNKGFLPCGNRYYVYRIALYADGFKQFKSLANTNNVVGVYLLPLGLPSQKRCSVDAARLLTVVPHGQDVGRVFRQIEDDLVEASTAGVVGVDPYGNVARIFVDPVSFFGDYPAVTAMTDVRGHTATAFCTFCTMRRRTQSEGRSLLHLSQAHSRRLGYMRFDARTNAIRASNPPTDMLQALGLSNDSGRTVLPAEETPLVHYARRVRDLSRGNMRSSEVLSMEFDPCLNVAAAPDHLFTGMIGDLLFVCMMSMDSDRRREEAETEIIHAAYVNGLPQEGRFLKWDQKKCVGLVSVTMTTKLCLLFCSVHVFRREYVRTGKDVFLIPAKLQGLVSLAYAVPSEECQGPKAKTMCTEEGQLNFHGKLNRKVRDYIKMCDKLFRSSNPHGKALNKPNVHRALELCVLTIASFGHARNCSEMVLESMHRTVKRWLEKNTHGDSHITAVEHGLMRDWLGRLHRLYNQWLSESKEDYDRAEVGLFRLLLGEEALGMKCREDVHNNFVTQFRVAMANAFRKPVLDEMGRSENFGEGGEGAYAWELSTAVRGEEENESETFRSALELLHTWYQSNGMDDVELTEFKTAKYIVTETADGKRRCYQHNKLRRGCAVSIVVRPRGQASIVKACSMDDERGELQFYAIYEFISSSNGDKWCVVKGLSRTGETYSVVGSQVAVLQLGRRVRRVAVMHVCDRDCRVLVDKRKVVHKQSLLSGGSYYILTREDGYPPHVG